ncbi:VOC family protein [Marinoscillum furvescens]|uniref:Glyoxalase/bleomycin resistance protein/dioxygenase superfamily protein n=1 Tax=Marinoscillum furvescens DSM 4134 TaxID=1122208 RepID=A0A3D9L5Y8_MARFU|nr:VOC family protein [Marinoscillum furvescens]REE00136.1 glyoxalase/bleomycin resistance protein/dioxygenase superfamily protein [Marinoscillum furvescens DSM 4134]
MKPDLVIGVKDVRASAMWYEQVFQWKARHGGEEFEVLTQQGSEVMLCLHKWGTHEHPTLRAPSDTPGNGLILYFRTPQMHAIRARMEKLGFPVVEEVHLNPNSGIEEFSFRDPDGYYITASADHTFGLA